MTAVDKDPYLSLPFSSLFGTIFPTENLFPNRFQTSVSGKPGATEAWAAPRPGGGDVYKFGVKRGDTNAKQNAIHRKADET